MKQYSNGQMPDMRRRVQVVEDDPEPSGRRKSSVWLTVLIVVFAAVFLVSAGVLIWEMVVNPFIADQNAEEIQEVFVEAGGVAGTPAENETEGEEAIEKLQEINPDISGWLRLENTNINQPVLLPPADDPEYYLYRNYKKEDTKYGSIFLDASSPVGADNQLLHGHSMQDGRMFWSLISFGDPEVVKKTPVIQYDTYKEAGDWKIVSVFKTNTLASQGKVFNYLQGDFSSPEEKMQFYYDVMKRSMVDTGVDLNEDDRTIMLSTCSYEYDNFRTVVMARKVREGEDANVDTAQIKASENPLFPDVWYASGSAPDYWPEKFEDALKAGKIDWYTGDLYQ